METVPLPSARTTTPTTTLDATVLAQRRDEDSERLDAAAPVTIEKRRVRLGRLFADALTFPEAIDAILALARAGAGGYVVTPNVDHVCLAEEDPSLVDAYRGAALSLVDGTPLLWLARLCGEPLPAKISGADLIEPLLARAAQEGLRVFFFGAAPGVADAAAARLKARVPGLLVCGTASPALGFEREPGALEGALREVQETRPHLVLVALGCPKQERFMRAHAAALAPAVCLGIGAGLDFCAGRMRRAPAFVSRIGLEWAFRLAQEPGRLWQRYLVRDRAIVRIGLGMLRLRLWLRLQPRAASVAQRLDPP